jgi:hypothetical protein
VPTTSQDNSVRGGADIKIKAASSADNSADNIADNSAHGGADIKITAVGSADSIAETSPTTAPYVYGDSFDANIKKQKPISKCVSSS